MAQFQVTLTKSVMHVVTIEAEDEMAAEFAAYNAVQGGAYDAPGILAHKTTRENIDTNYTTSEG